MKAIRPPIFMVPKNDVVVEGFASVRDAAGSLETWYVEEHAPLFFDSLGRELRLEGNGPYRLTLPQDARIDHQKLSEAIADAIVIHTQELKEREKLRELVGLFERIFM